MRYYLSIRLTVCILPFLVLFICGCDPIGLGRVDLRLPARASRASNVTLDSQDIQDAWKILDSVFAKEGHIVSRSSRYRDLNWDIIIWTPLSSNPAETVPGYIRVYDCKVTSVEPDGRVSHFIHTCRVRRISHGIEVTFGEPVFGGPGPMDETLLGEVRLAFIERYGKQNVRIHRFGVPLDLSPHAVS